LKDPALDAVEELAAAMAKRRADLALFLGLGERSAEPDDFDRALARRMLDSGPDPRSAA
jgi:hypothetical protein